MIGNKGVFIIAEAGVNHDGDVHKAKDMVLIAKKAGADAIKFQTWKTENVIVKDAQKPDYQMQSDSSESQYDMLKRLELPYEAFIEIKGFCDIVGIEFMSTADEYESASFLQPFINIVKIASSELTDLPYLAKLARFDKQTLLSTGMADVNEIKKAVEVLQSNGLSKEKIIVLHANTEYPTPFEDANLLAIPSLKKELGLPIGYSDHTLGIEAPIAAVALGACVIEKHFTLNKYAKGPDHSSSVEPDELSRMVDAIRHIEVSLGDGIKRPSNSEIKNIPNVRKSIVAKIDIAKGEELTEQNITIKRPASGLSPIRWYDVIGTKAVRDFDKDEFIEIG